MTSVPVSVMAADVEHESIWVILKIISAKTKALAACEDFLEMRGIYRSGLLGKGGRLVVIVLVDQVAVGLGALHLVVGDELNPREALA